MTSEATIAELAITNLSQGTKYTINVRGKNQRGPGPWSTEAASVETPGKNRTKVYIIPQRTESEGSALKALHKYWRRRNTFLKRMFDSIAFIASLAC